MPKFRVSYVERDFLSPVEDKHWTSTDAPHLVHFHHRKHQTAWTEEVEAPNAVQALEKFFDGHADPVEVRRLDPESGKGVQMYASDRYEPDATYLWIEGGKFMEYEGIEPVIFGRTICPLCEGKGGIDSALADYYYESEELN